MTEQTNHTQIRIKGHLSSRTARAFTGFQVQLLPEGDTLLSGPVEDAAALYGLIFRLRDLGLELVSLQQHAGTDPPPQPGEPA